MSTDKIKVAVRLRPFNRRGMYFRVLPLGILKSWSNNVCRVPCSSFLTETTDLLSHRHNNVFLVLLQRFLSVN